MVRMVLGAALLLSPLAGGSPAQQPKKPAAPPRPTPTVADLAYGKHERQVLDFWQARSDKPTPLVLYIHGGGWQGGDKSSLGAAAIRQYLDAGIAVAAINYRYVKQAAAQKVEPPVKAPLEDAARALQLIRSKAGEWKLDRKRVGATGGSAGGCSSLWLALHDDLADPKSDDPVARESTRLYCAAVNGAQTSLDPKGLREWMPNYGYGAHAFGFPNFQAFHEGRGRVLRWIREYSPIEHVSKDDPPIFMDYPGQKVPPVVGEKQADPTHSAVLGLKLAEKLKSAGVEVVLVYPGRTHPRYKNAAQFLIDRLKK
jgi:acetyl esterase/lipase